MEVGSAPVSAPVIEQLIAKIGRPWTLLKAERQRDDYGRTIEVPFERITFTALDLPLAELKEEIIDEGQALRGDRILYVWLWDSVPKSDLRPGVLLEDPEGVRWRIVDVRNYEGKLIFTGQDEAKVLRIQVTREVIQP